MQRDRVRCRNAKFYHGLLAYCGVPQLPPRRRCRVEPLRREVELPVVLSSDTSGDDLPEPAPERLIVLLDLDSSVESLPNIDPRPQWQLPVEPLRDLGPLDIMAECQPPLQHQVFREAYVLLQHLQLLPLRPITPPPELQPLHQTPPHHQAVDWVELEAAVATFDGQEYLVVPRVPLLQQPEVVPVPQHIPTGFATPPPMPEVYWAGIARALFTVVERQS